jgi:hypothetical protein
MSTREHRIGGQCRSLFLNFVLFISGIGACSGKSAKEESRDPPVECKQYEAALDACYHRHTLFASQAALIPTSEDARVRIRQMCVDSLNQLKRVCGPAADPTPRP